MVAPIGAALLPGIAAWQVLAKTQTAEKARYAKQPEVAREIEYFKANIGKVTSAADLVKDRRLLAVALGAFGLDSEINSQARIRKVLEGGTLNPKSLANQLIDPRYKDMSGTFQFDLFDGDKLKDAKFVQGIIDRYTTNKFEGAVGDSNPALQNALYFQRKMSSVTNWYTVLADKPLFAVVKATLGLPDNFSKIDVDKQASILESKVKLDKLKTPAETESFAKRYLAISTAQTSQVTSPAVQLLDSIASRGSLSSSALSVLLSNQGLS